MIILLQLTTIILTAFVAGIALAASIVVHPILLQINRKSAIEIFKPFFDKTHKIVLVFSLLASLCALGVSVMSGHWGWFGLSMLMHLNGPYTLKFMMPLNRRLMEPDIDPYSNETASDLKKWGSLHAVRSVLNIVIFAALVALSLGAI